MFYSKSTGGFYDPNINTLIPDDAVEISRATHAALLAGQAEGKRIVSDLNGFPVLTDPEPVTPPTPEEILAKKVQECLDYLNKTDFYYPRLLETGESVPEEVVLKRKESREFIRTNSLVGL